MRIIMTFYVIPFSYFSHLVSKVFTQTFIIYVFRFFFTEFCKDSIYSIQCLSAQGEVLQHKYTK
jgi:hypothetical protein